VLRVDARTVWLAPPNPKAAGSNWKPTSRAGAHVDAEHARGMTDNETEEPPQAHKLSHRRARIDPRSLETSITTWWVIPNDGSLHVSGRLRSRQESTETNRLGSLKDSRGLRLNPAHRRRQCGARSSRILVLSTKRSLSPRVAAGHRSSVTPCFKSIEKLDLPDPHGRKRATLSGGAVVGSSSAAVPLGAGSRGSVREEQRVRRSRPAVPMAAEPCCCAIAAS
jgi:hypothetical protein